MQDQSTIVRCIVTSNTFTDLKLANDSLRSLKLVSLEGQRRLRLLNIVIVENEW